MGYSSLNPIGNRRSWRISIEDKTRFSEMPRIRFKNPVVVMPKVVVALEASATDSVVFCPLFFA